MSKSNYTTMRLRSLIELKDKHHNKYVEIFCSEKPSLMTKQEKDKAINEMINEYIPNVVHDFPYLLSAIEENNKHIEYLKNEIIELIKQRNRAFKKLGWKISDIYDYSEMYDHLDDDLDI